MKAHGGRSAVYAQHVRAMNALIAPSGARVMLWDDGIESDPSILQHIPRSAVIVNWHYDVRATYLPLIRTMAAAGFDQMVAPGAQNWNRFFPDLNDALVNERRFIAQGRDAHVLGLFQTVWHDDGATLAQETWYPVLYAAAQAWSDDPAFDADFAPAFFGSDDQGFARDALALRIDRTCASGAERSARICRSVYAHRPPASIRHTIRLQAEAVETHLLAAHAPLHAGAAQAMLFAAQRYDALGRRFQIADEVRAVLRRCRPLRRTTRFAISSGASIGFGNSATPTSGSRALYATLWRDGRS